MPSDHLSASGARRPTKRALASFILALQATSVLAQDRTCDQEWAAVTTLAGVTQLSQGVVVTADGWCEAWDLQMGNPEGYGVMMAADVVRWRGEGMGLLVDGTGLPTTLEAEVEGARAIPRSGDAVADWAMATQSDGTGFDGRVDLAWDHVTHVLEVREASLDFGEGNAVTLTASVAGLNLTSTAALTTSAASAGLTRLGAQADLNGVFEAYLLLPLATMLIPYGVRDPAAEVKALKGEATDAIASVPDAIASGEARAEMTEVVASLPHPRGVLRIEVEAEPPLGAPRFAATMLGLAPLTSKALWSALEGVTVEVDWAGRQFEE